MLDQVGLASVAGKPAGGLSLGMAQRLGLAPALLADPRALLLDEQANGLDPHGVAWLRELLRAFAAEGGAALVSSHLLAELLGALGAVVDRTGDGELVVSRADARVVGDLAHRHRLRLHELTTQTPSLEAAVLGLTRSDIEYAAGDRP